MDAPTEPIDISLVLTTCSRAATLRGALESLLAQTLLDNRGVEVLVVDDQSVDNTAELLEDFQANSPIAFTVLPGARQGTASARNLAVSRARGRWIAAFDDDQVAPPHWLESLYDTALHHQADCVGGSTWLSLPPGHTLEEVNFRARRLLGEVPLTGQARPLNRDHLPAANNVLLRREVFDALGGFDPSFTEGGDDTNFFQRMRDAGFRIWVEPAAEVLRLIPESRLQPEAICRSAVRRGAVEARLRRARSGYARLLANVAGHLGLAVLRDVPEILAARFDKDDARALDARLSLCVTKGLLGAVPNLRSRNR